MSTAVSNAFAPAGALPCHSDFPLVCFETAQFKRALRFAVIAMEVDPCYRFPGINGVGIERQEDGNYSLVATDGKRLHRAALAPIAEIADNTAPALWLSAETIKAVLKAPQGHKIGFYGEAEDLTIVYTAKGESVFTRQQYPDGLPRFPDCRAVDLWLSGRVSQEWTATAPARSWYKLFAEIARPVALFDFPGEGGQVVASRRHSFKDSFVKVEGAQAFSIAFNYSYAMDFFESQDFKNDEVSIVYGSDSCGGRQVKIEYRDFRAVFMPCKDDLENW
jgi:hypothetical protein